MTLLVRPNFQKKNRCSGVSIMHVVGDDDGRQVPASSLALGEEIFWQVVDGEISWQVHDGEISLEARAGGDPLRVVV